MTHGHKIVETVTFDPPLKPTTTDVVITNGVKMATQFHEGQDVEVADKETDIGLWRKAKIVSILATCKLWPGPAIEVQFPEPDGKYDMDGSRAVFDAEHIREVTTP